MDLSSVLQMARGQWQDERDLLPWLRRGLFRTDHRPHRERYPRQHCEVLSQARAICSGLRWATRRLDEAITIRWSLAIFLGHRWAAANPHADRRWITHLSREAASRGRRRIRLHREAASPERRRIHPPRTAVSRLDQRRTRCRVHQRVTLRARARRVWARQIWARERILVRVRMEVRARMEIVRRPACLAPPGR